MFTAKLLLLATVLAGWALFQHGDVTLLHGQLQHLGDSIHALLDSPATASSSGLPQ